MSLNKNTNAKKTHTPTNTNPTTLDAQKAFDPSENLFALFELKFPELEAKDFEIFLKEKDDK